MTETAIRRYRSVFISDVHLGTRGRQAELLLDFIRHMDCETLYLVADIVDGWKMKSGWYWPQSHNDVVQKILRMARKGVSAIYVPGIHFGAVAVADEARRRGIDGVICGHIHKAESRMIDGVAYIVDGDWVESCAALVEHADGELEILEWTKVRQNLAAPELPALAEPLAA